MDISIMHSTSDYRGDHSTDVLIAVSVRDGETVEQLVERVLKVPGVHNGAFYADHIEIRLVQP